MRLSGWLDGELIAEDVEIYEMIEDFQAIMAFVENVEGH